ncbi:MAG: nicotinamide-nucleotide amidohydrolase family protein, partial [Bacteroidota bacterium]|nr:nicotinamide-nucleotide amidohydrolase family protein [Bacteroidota bacterium]
IVEEYDRPHIVHKTIMTYGMGESAVAEKLEDWENNLPSYIKFAYLPNLGSVRLRLSAKGNDKETLMAGIEEQVEKLYPLIGDIIYGEEEEDGRVEKQIGTLLTDKGLTLSTAESFTGGAIAERITAVPGASNYFMGSMVCYATEAKVNVLGVPRELIDEHSVVSEAVAIAMAENVKTKLNSDFAIATTGNAGPTKGDSDADVGTVYIGISTPKGTFAQKFTMGRHRERVVKKSVNKAFELLYKEILNF